MSPKRLLEQASSAHLLNTLSGLNVNGYLKKDENGKPFIENSQLSVSFSHSRKMIACLIDFEGGKVGVDIEEQRESIGKIAHKFISEKDRTPYVGIKHQHLIWGGKEVLYKIYSKRELDFIKHLNVDFETDKKGTILKNERIDIYLLDYTEINNFILVWNI